jgi:prolyl-tRNA editing enzyme YbaK/EbsC (Cys-tRNA(Pro) deacylase)
MNNLERWKGHLSENEIDSRLEAGFHDVDSQVRRRAMLVAGKIGRRAFVPLLVSALQGKPLETRPPPDTPADEAEEIAARADPVAEMAAKAEPVAGDCADREVAALALGYLKYQELKSLLVADAESSPMYEVALALIGEPQRLRLAHFQAESANQELQLAAVEAIVRCRGRYGLGFAVQYEQATHWWEPEHVAKRLVSMLRDEQAPGIDSIEDIKDLKPLKRWFDQFGEQYLERFEK